MYIKHPGHSHPHALPSPAMPGPLHLPYTSLSDAHVCWFCFVNHGFKQGCLCDCGSGAIPWIPVASVVDLQQKTEISQYLPVANSSAVKGRAP